MKVVLSSPWLCDRGIGSIKVDAQHFDAVETEAYSCRIPRRVTEEIGVGHAAEEAMDQDGYPLVVTTMDCPGARLRKTVPRGIEVARAGASGRICARTEGTNNENVKNAIASRFITRDLRQISDCGKVCDEDRIDKCAIAQRARPRRLLRVCGDRR